MAPRHRARKRPDENPSWFKSAAAAALLFAAKVIYDLWRDNSGC